MEDSPSKDLAEDLQSFHISSPVKQRIATTKITSSDGAVKNFSKQYIPNNEFADSKFLSYLGDSESKSYIKRLGDWSMNYGTVQQRSKSPVKKGDKGLDGVSSPDEDGEVSDDHLDPPQFKQYLNSTQSKLKKQQPESEQISRDPESELILTASLNDISGIPTNTFKRHDHHDKRKYLQTGEIKTSTLNKERISKGEPATENTQEIEEDIDPALEARGVFDNILKTQKSNYDFNQDMRVNTTRQSALKDKSDSDATSSYLGETPSSLSPNFGIYPAEKPAIDGLKLITPEEMGLVFDNVNGVWYKPPARNQDISSSRTMDSSATGTNTDSTMTTTSSTAGSDMVEHLNKKNNRRSIATSANTKVARKTDSRPSLPIMNEKEESLEEKVDDIEDDTPLDAPQINPQYLLRGSHTSRKKKNAALQRLDDTQNYIGNVTTASQLETSFQQNKRELISILTDVIPPRRSDWSTILQIDLSKKSLSQVVGLDEILPKVIDCNLSLNNLRGLQGVPPTTIRLNCQSNKITTSYFTLENLPHLETIDLSHNLIGYNLSILSNSIHLRDVNLSHNNIKSMGGDLGISRILRLDLSNNKISGVIDFAKLVKYNKQQDGFGWSTLEELNLSNNKITAVKNVYSLTNLRVLKLDGNPIEEMVEDNGGKSYLKTLSITNTRRSLTRLGTNRNQMPYHHLRILRTESFKHLCYWKSMPRSLEELAIFDGTVEELPAWKILPNSLRRLTLTRIQGLKELPEYVAYQLPSLQELSLANNQLESCYKLIQALPTLCLVRLNIEKNPLVSSQRKSNNSDLVRALHMACPRLKQLQIDDSSH